MKRFVLLAVLLGLLISACGPSLSEWYTNSGIEAILTRFESKVALAETTPRDEVNAIRVECVDLRTDLQIIANDPDLPKELVAPLDQVLDAMDVIIDGMGDWTDMSGFSDMTDEEWDAKDQRAIQKWNRGSEQHIQARAALRKALED